MNATKNTNPGAKPMTYTAHNSLTNETLDTDSMADALAHIGRHVHVTREDGRTALPMDLDSTRPLWKVQTVTLWAELTGRTIRHDIAMGNVKGTVAGWIRRNG